MKPIRTRAPVTYADLEALPAHVVGEILHGELVVSPRPAPKHARACSRLSMRLGPPFDLGDGGPGGWGILFEPELHLGADVVVPDLAGWRRERLPSLPEIAWFELAPDWVCEVLSPSTARHDRAQKLAIYARERVAHAWLVDPLARTLEVLRLVGEAGWLIAGVHGGDAVVRAEPFAAIELDLLSLWGETREP
jgi:Uma2 family endonuclease